MGGRWRVKTLSSTKAIEARGQPLNPDSESEGEKTEALGYTRSTRSIQESPLTSSSSETSACNSTFQCDHPKKRRRGRNKRKKHKARRKGRQKT